MTVNAQRQSLGALEQDPGVERADAGALVTQQDSADIGCEGGGTGSLGKRNAVVGGVGLGDLGVLSARLPIEVTAVDDHTAQRGAVAADELVCGGNRYGVPKVLSTTTGRPCFLAISEMASMLGMSELGLPSVSR